MKIEKLFVLTVFILCPFMNFTVHGGSVDRDDLDDDIVEKFPVPVLFGLDYDDIAPDFGAPRGGGTRSHEGQDFLSPEGTPIVSPTEAIVIKTGTGQSAGNYVYTANPGGETFRYMHLDDVARLKTGDELDAGDYIGTVGDTGNAPYGVFHLHFEVRDEDNKAVDPYDRTDEDGFSLKKKMLFLRNVFKDRRDDDEYAEFLVETFKSDFVEAVSENYSLPNAIDDAVEDAGLMDEKDSVDSLKEVIASLPEVLDLTLSKGDQNVFVVLLQIYLIYTGEGQARDYLMASTPTGYYGNITKAAVLEYQSDILGMKNPTGVYDSGTRKEMIEQKSIELNII